MNPETETPLHVGSNELLAAGCCPECGSRELTWHAGTKNYGGVQDGRICMREVGPIFYLGCDECFETIKVITGNVVAALLTEMQAENDPSSLTRTEEGNDEH